MIQTLTTSEVKSLFEKSKKIEEPVITIYYRLQHQDIPSKFAVTVPKKKIKKAVRRNRIKRQIKAIIRQEKVVEILLQKNINLWFLVLYNTHITLEYHIIKQHIEASFFQILQNVESRN